MARKLQTAASRVAGIRRQARETTPSVSSSPIGFISSRVPGYFPPTNIGSYGVIASEGPPPAGFVGVNLIYRTGITCQPAGYTNISEATCLANGWEMRDSAGNVLRNSAYGGVLADPGLPAYQNAWCDAALTRIQQLSANGLWIDDTTPGVTDFTGGVWPAKYPNRDSYMLAVLSFAANAYTFFQSRNMKIAFNTAISSDDNASQTNVWWRRIGVYAHYLTEEYWLAPNDRNLRLAGSEWYNNWDGHRALHAACQSVGCGFLPLTYNLGPWTQAQGRSYTLGTFMLDWDGQKGANMWTPTDAIGTQDPWGTFYQQAIDLGAPIASPIQTSANVWARSFANGTLTVNANNGTATITGV